MATTDSTSALANSSPKSCDSTQDSTSAAAKMSPTPQDPVEPPTTLFLIALNCAPLVLFYILSAFLPDVDEEPTGIQWIFMVLQPALLATIMSNDVINDLETGSSLPKTVQATRPQTSQWYFTTFKLPSPEYFEQALASIVVTAAEISENVKLGYSRFLGRAQVLWLAVVSTGLNLELQAGNQPSSTKSTIGLGDSGRALSFLIGAVFGISIVLSPSVLLCLMLFWISVFVYPVLYREPHVITSELIATSGTETIESSGEKPQVTVADSTSTPGAEVIECVVDTAYDSISFSDIETTDFFEDVIDNSILSLDTVVSKSLANTNFTPATLTTVELSPTEQEQEVDVVVDEMAFELSWKIVTTGVFLQVLLCLISCYPAIDLIRFILFELSENEPSLPRFLLFVIINKITFKLLVDQSRGLVSGLSKRVSPILRITREKMTLSQWPNASNYLLYFGSALVWAVLMPICLPIFKNYTAASDVNPCRIIVFVELQLVILAGIHLKDVYFPQPRTQQPHPDQRGQPEQPEATAYLRSILVAYGLLCLL